MDARRAVLCLLFLGLAEPALSTADWHADFREDQRLSHEVFPTPGFHDEGPDDPRERGPCSIHITLVDSETGQPLTSSVHLWRLDVSASEHWTRGDQLQASLRVGPGGRTFSRLPKGRYRIHAGAQRLGSADPPAFEIKAGGRVQFSIPTPRKQPVFVRVFDEDGRELKQGHASPSGSLALEQRTSPTWRVQRERKVRSGTIGIGGGAGSLFPARCGTHPCRAGPKGFSVGSVQESTRVRSRQRQGWFYFEARTGVTVTARFTTDCERVFWAVSVPLKTLHLLVKLPDGSLAIDQGAYFYTWCDATLATSQPFDPGDHFVRVQVALRGYKDVHFKYVPGKPTPVQTMVVKEP